MYRVMCVTCITGRLGHYICNCSIANALAHASIYYVYTRITERASKKYRETEQRVNNAHRLVSMVVVSYGIY